MIITDNLASTLQYTHVMLKRSVNCKTMFFNIKRHRRGSKFPYDVFEKMTPNYLEKEKFRVIMKKRKILPPFFMKRLK